MNNKRLQLIQEVLEALAGARGSVRHGHGPMFKKQGFGPSHFRLLMKLANSLANSDKGMTVGELSKAMDITPAAITQFIDKLVAKGMVERFEDPADRRIVRIRLTAKSQKKFSALKSHYYDRMNGMFKNLSDEELEQLAGIIKKIEVEPGDFPGHGHWHKWHEIKKDIK